MKKILVKQKSRMRWINEGDSNTKFLHSCIQERRRRNHILFLEVDGQCVEQVGEMKKKVRRFFEDGFKEYFFSRPIPGGVEFQTLILEDNSLLVTPFTEKDIKEGEWNCDGNRCLWLDGFNLRFIK